MLHAPTCQSDQLLPHSVKRQVVLIPNMSFEEDFRCQPTQWIIEIEDSQTISTGPRQDQNITKYVPLDQRLIIY